MANRPMIEWDAAKLRRLKGRYRLAVASNQEQFTLYGHEFLVSYAKYLIEYLESQLAAIH